LPISSWTSPALTTPSANHHRHRHHERKHKHSKKATTHLSLPDGKNECDEAIPPYQVAAFYEEKENKVDTHKEHTTPAHAQLERMDTDDVIPVPPQYSEFDTSNQVAAFYEKENKVDTHKEHTTPAHAQLERMSQMDTDDRIPVPPQYSFDASKKLTEHKLSRTHRSSLTTRNVQTSPDAQPSLFSSNDNDLATLPTFYAVEATLVREPSSNLVYDAVLVPEVNEDETQRQRADPWWKRRQSRVGIAFAFAIVIVIAFVASVAISPKNEEEALETTESPTLPPTWENEDEEVVLVEEVTHETIESPTLPPTVHGTLVF
jgi:hypothetical protein